MDERTRNALEASIKHWEENVAAEKPEDASTGPSSCALCQEFKNCSGCPVMKRTGFDGCIGTPWGKANMARYDWSFNDGTVEQFRAAAQAELDFLISLRPENNREEQ